MKKRVLTAAFGCALAAGMIVLLIAFGGRKPYKDLNAPQISAATVRLTPPDKTVGIEDIQELVDYMNDLIIYQEDDSYAEYVGQGIVFTLTMADGTRQEIMAYNPFLVIDGIGYRTKYEPCEALRGYANRLLNAENAKASE